MPSIDQWLSFAACLAAFIAAFSTFWTVREMAKQRRASLKPELVVNGLMISLQTRYDTQQKRLFLPGSSLQFENDKLKPELTQSVRVINIGMGSAKNVHASWIIDADKLARKINKVAGRSSIDTKLKYDAGLGTLEFGGKGIHTRLHMVKNQIGGQWNYLAPVSVDEKGIELVLPPFFVDACLFGLVAAHKCGSFNQVMDELNDLFVAEVVLSYLDILDNSYQKSHKFALELLYSKKKPADEKEKEEVYDFDLMFGEIGTIWPLSQKRTE